MLRGRLCGVYLSTIWGLPSGLPRPSSYLAPLSKSGCWRVLPVILAERVTPVRLLQELPKSTLAVHVSESASTHAQIATRALPSPANQAVGTEPNTHATALTSFTPTMPAATLSLLSQHASTPPITAQALPAAAAAAEPATLAAARLPHSSSRCPAGACVSAAAHPSWQSARPAAAA